MKYFPPREGNSENQFFQYHHSLVANKETILIHKKFILFLLGLNLGYPVKYRPLPLGVLLGFALRNSLRQSAKFDPNPLSGPNMYTVYSS